MLQSFKFPALSFQADPPPPYQPSESTSVGSSLKKTIGAGLKRLPSTKRSRKKPLDDPRSGGDLPESILAERLQRANTKKVIKEDLETGEIVVVEESTANAGLQGMFKKTRKIRK